MNNNVGLVNFWKERFQTESLEDWTREFSFDIANIASTVSIDWDKSQTDRIIPGVMFKESKYLKVTDSKQRHFLELNWREARNGISYPVIQFTSHTEGTTWFNGYEFLLELFEREGGVALSDVQRDRIQQKRLEQEAEQQSKKLRAEKMLRLQEKHAVKWRANYQKRWAAGEKSPEIVAQHSYLVKKGISAKVIEAGALPLSIASGREFHKNDLGVYGKQARSWLAIPMQNFMGDYVGHQRIYENGKAHARASDMAQAHYVIGDIVNAKQLEYVEGYATGASIYKTAIAEDKAADVCVLVCFDKRGLARILQHYQQKWKAKKHIVRADNDHFKWLEGKGNAGMMAALELQQQTGCQATFPDFDHVSIDIKPTDYNDLEMLGGQTMMAKQLWGNAISRIKADKNLFEFKLQMLRLTGQQSWKKHAKAAAVAGAHLIPDQLDRKTVIDAIFNAVPGMVKFKAGDKKAIAGYLSWMVNKRFEEAAATKNFSKDILKQDNINHIKVQAVMDSRGFPVIPDSVLDMVKGLRGASILKASHGMGKTQKVMGPLMREEENGASMIVHRVTLADQMANELGLRHYQDLIMGFVDSGTKLVSCVNSINQPKFDGYFENAALLCIDEATQVLRHVMAGGEAIHAPVKTYNKLLTAVRSAKKVLLADADANDSLIELLQQARPGQMINVIEVVSPAIDLTVKYCDSVEFVFHKIIETAKANAEIKVKSAQKRILVATDSISKAESIAQGVRDAWPQARVLCVTSNTKGEHDSLEFSKNPNEAAKNIDVLIYSPVISSGVSIKDAAAKFDAHFGLFHGVTVPSDILQQMRRDRNASQFLVGFRPNHDKRQTDRDAMVRGLMDAHHASASALNWSESESDIAIKKTPFDEMYLDVKISESKARNNYISHSLMLMAAEGWKIERADVDAVDAAVGKSELSASKNLVTTQRHELIMNQTTPEEGEYLQLKRRELITQKEAAMVTRFEIENQLGVQVTNESIEFFDNRGLSKVRRLELLQGTQQQAEEVESWEQQRGVVLTQRRLTLAKWTKLTHVFNVLGICPLTGAGQFNVDQARKVMDDLAGNTKAMDAYNALNIGPQVTTKPTCPTRFVKGILERILPVVNGKKVQGVQYYRLHAEKFSDLQRYITARNAIGKNSLVIDSTAELHDDNYTVSQAINSAQAPLSVACSEGGEIIDSIIYNSNEISPQQKHLLLSLVDWLKPTTNSNQTNHETGVLEWMQMTGELTVKNLMRLARGWLDPMCNDDRWGDVVPMLASEA